MAKKNKVTLREDLIKHKVAIPFELYEGIKLVVNELENNYFKYSHLTTNGTNILTFNSKIAKQKVSINVKEDTLLVRQYDTSSEKRKLLVLYVVKSTLRAFKLHNKKNKVRVKNINNN